MRRRNRQKLISGDEQEWCHRRARRAYRLTRKPGLGKYNKRNMARRRRRESRRYNAQDEGEEDPVSAPDAGIIAMLAVCVLLDGWAIKRRIQRHSALGL